MSILVQAYFSADGKTFAEAIASTLKAGMLDDPNLNEYEVGVVVIPTMNKTSVIAVFCESQVSFRRRKDWKNNLAARWKQFLHQWPGFTDPNMKILIFGEQLEINPLSTRL